MIHLSVSIRIIFISYVYIKTKPTLFIDKDVRDLAKLKLKSSRFKSLSSYVEDSLKKMDDSSDHSGSFVKKWKGILGSEKEIQVKAQQDLRLKSILDKHCKAS